MGCWALGDCIFGGSIKESSLVDVNKIESMCTFKKFYASAQETGTGMAFTALFILTNFLEITKIWQHSKL